MIAPSLAVASARRPGRSPGPSCVADCACDSASTGAEVPPAAAAPVARGASPSPYCHGEAIRDGLCMRRARACSAMRALALVAAAAGARPSRGAGGGRRGRSRSCRTAPSTISSCCRSRGKRASNSVRGRILYDFSGSACDGYALQFRQVSELDCGEGKVRAQRSARHHLGGRRRQELPLQLAEFARPTAMPMPSTAAPSATATDVAVKLEQAEGEDVRPDGRTWCFRPSTCAASSRRRAPARPCSKSPVYDGSDSGEKIYNTLTRHRRADRRHGAASAPDRRRGRSVAG